MTIGLSPTREQRVYPVPRNWAVADRQPRGGDRLRRAAARLPSARRPASRAVVLAALDGGTATWPVLATARQLGNLLGAVVRAVHVRPAGAALPHRLSALG